MKIRYFLLFALAAALTVTLAACSHSTSAGSGNQDTLYSLTGSVNEIILIASGFDTVYWQQTTENTAYLTGAKNETAATGLSGTFFFDSLPAGNYNIEISKSGYVPATLHVTEPPTVKSQNAMHLYPESWIQPTIDYNRPDSDHALGEDIFVHLKSMLANAPALGTVYLYLSKNRGIDPKDPTSYDMIYPAIGSIKDSSQELQVQPGLVHAIYPKGTLVYCLACASPFQDQYTLPSYDSTGKIIYPYFKYTSNTVSFQIP